MIILLTSIGFVLSLYSLYVKSEFRKNKKYKALCDINDKISCTKVFSSSYGSLFKIDNGYFGIFAYPLINLFYLLNLQLPLIIFSSVAVLLSVYLAYLSYYKLRNFCLVCTGIYIVNILIFIKALTYSF